MKNEIIEREIIWCMLMHTKDIPEILQLVDVDHFTTYQKYFSVIREAWKENKNITAEVLAAKLKISTIIPPTTFRKVSHACAELLEISKKRQIGTILDEASKNVPERQIEAFVGDIQQRLIHAISINPNEDTSIDTAIAEFAEYQAVFEEKKKNGGKLLGLSTGYPKLDEVIDGIRPEHLWVLGGYTNLGKTYASINILTHLLKQKKRTVFYSLEMSRVDIISRILGILLNKNGSSVAKGYEDKTSVDNALEIIRESNLGIHNTKTDLNQILLSMYEETLRSKPELFVLDFIQLVTVKGASGEYEATTQAILELQKAAKRLKVPIIVLSQVSNESARNGDQQVMGFKGSGAIAAAADLAIELVSGEESVQQLREKMNNGEPVKMKWHIKKNRHGRVGSILMEFTGKTGVFTEYEEKDF